MSAKTEYIYGKEVSFQGIGDPVLLKSRTGLELQGSINVVSSPGTSDANILIDGSPLSSIGAGGADTQLQFNNSGALDGHSGLTTDGTDLILGGDITSVDNLSVMSTGAAKNVTVETTGSGGTTFLGAATADTLTRIGNAAITQGIIAGGSQIGGTLAFGGNSSRTGAISFGSSAANYAFNVNAGTCLLKSNIGVTDIVGKTDVTIDSGIADDIILGTDLQTGNVILGNGTQTGTVQSLAEFVCPLLNVIKSGVTQITSISTGVTLNIGCGKITTVSLTLASHAKATFTVTNSKVVSGSVIMLSVQSYTGSGSVGLMVNSVGSGTFDITLTNTSGSSLDTSSTLGFLVV